MQELISSVVHQAVTNSHFREWFLADPKGAAAAHNFILNDEDETVLTQSITFIRDQLYFGPEMLAPWAAGLSFTKAATS